MNNYFSKHTLDSKIQPHACLLPDGMWVYHVHHSHMMQPSIKTATSSCKAVVEDGKGLGPHIKS
jgi:hypothetical protein